MTANLLTLNSSKTEFLLIRLSKQLAKINNSSLNTTHSARNLGFIFDEHLTKVFLVRDPQLGPGPLVRLTQIWGDFWREVGEVRDRVRTLLIPNVIMEFVFWNDITVYIVIGASVVFSNRQVAYLKVR